MISCCCHSDSLPLVPRVWFRQAWRHQENALLKAAVFLTSRALPFGMSARQLHAILIAGGSRGVQDSGDRAYVPLMSAIQEVCARIGRGNGLRDLCQLASTLSTVAIVRRYRPCTRRQHIQSGRRYWSNGRCCAVTATCKDLDLHSRLPACFSKFLCLTRNIPAIPNG